MIDDIFGGVASWATAFVLACVVGVPLTVHIWAEHIESVTAQEAEHEVDLVIVRECTGEESVTRCAESLREALDP